MNEGKIKEFAKLIRLETLSVSVIGIAGVFDTIFRWTKHLYQLKQIDSHGLEINNQYALYVGRSSGNNRNNYFNLGNIPLLGRF